MMDAATAVALNVAANICTNWLDSAAANLLEAWANKSGGRLGENFSHLKDELRHAMAELGNLKDRPIGNPALNLLVQELRESADDADEVLDELEYFRLQEQLRQGPEALHQRLCEFLSRPAGRLLSAPAPDESVCFVFDQAGLARRLKEVAVQLRTRRESLHSVLPNPLPPKRTPAVVSRSTSPTPPPSESRVFGLDQRREQVISMFREHADSARVITVLPILGPGGVGKTTFARSIYNDVGLQDVFTLRIWICVSMGKFDVIRLIHEILDHLPPARDERDSNLNSTSLAYLHDLIVKRLNSANLRFLLILDDLWECNHRDWDDLIAPLKLNRARGSWIIATTRKPVIAQVIVNRDDPHPLEMSKLPNDVMQHYFEFCIFGDISDADKDPTLKAISEEIVPRLKGNPLAAKSISRLLVNNKDIFYWKEIRDKLVRTRWLIGQEEDCDIMEVLRLSYEYLEYPLNQCFFYCGLYPDDYAFNCDELVRFWMALGCIEPGGKTPSVRKSIEEVGRENLYTLVGLGFFEIIVDDNGEVKYQLHELLHQLARNILYTHECVVFDGSEFSDVILSTVRHVSIITKSMYVRDEYSVIHRNENFEARLLNFKNDLNLPKVKTLMLFGEYDSHFFNKFLKCFQEANGLRLLHVPILLDLNVAQQCLISKPLHLRYFRVDMLKFMPAGHRSEETVVTMPNSLSKYYHLKVIECDADKVNLPDDMHNLLNLRHLILSEDSHMKIADVGKLVQLQELRKFEVRVDDNFRLGQLGNLKELTGSLYLSKMLNVGNIDDVRKVKLEEKKLRCLLLSFDRDGLGNEDMHMQRMIIESIKPNEELQELHISSYRGQWFPTWLGEHCKYLKSLELMNCRAWETLRPISKLIGLKKLKLIGLANIKELQFNVSSSSGETFGWLEELFIAKMAEMIQLDMYNFSRLKMLSIIECPKLLELPFLNPPIQDDRFRWFHNLEDLHISGCSKLRTTFPALPHTPILRSLTILWMFVVVLESANYYWKW